MFKGIPWTNTLIGTLREHVGVTVSSNSDNSECGESRAPEERQQTIIQLRDSMAEMPGLKVLPYELVSLREAACSSI